MGVITDWFPAVSLEDAVSAVESGTHRGERWEARFGEPDVTLELGLLTSVVTGVPERDIGDGWGASAMVGDEGLVFEVSSHLVERLGTLPPEAMAAVVDELEEACVDWGGDTADVVADLAAFLGRAVGSGRRAYVFLCP